MARDLQLKQRRRSCWRDYWDLKALLLQLEEAGARVPEEEHDRRRNAFKTAEHYARKTLRISESLLRELQLEAQNAGYEVYVASGGDAEEEAAKRSGGGDLVSSDDLDALIFGAHRMVGFLDRLRKDTDARRPFCIELSELQAALGFASHRQLVEFAILCGCDYTGRLPGVGPHKAHRIISEYKSIGRFRLCKEGRAISKEAWANFKYKETRTLFEKKLVAALKPADRLKRRLVTGSPET
ncbi:unnamed protein product, partial [Effrenium voratum]